MVWLRFNEVGFVAFAVCIGEPSRVFLSSQRAVPRSHIFRMCRVAFARLVGCAVFCSPDLSDGPCCARQTFRIRRVALDQLVG